MRCAGIAVACLADLAASGCGDSKQRLAAGGSTFAYPLMSKWADEFRKARNVELNYQSIGSGGGIRQMIAKTFEFACTDGPMNEEQLRDARAVGGEVLHIPLALGAVVPVYNLEGVKRPLRFSGPILADIYLGKVTKWNDTALRELNPETELPDLEIVVLHRSGGSGTTSVWTDYLSRVSPEWKDRVGVGTEVIWPAGNGAGKG